jgi:hypothetical protein
LFSSCGGSDNKNEFRNDFDQIADWGFNSPMLKRGDAHSGVYYCAMDASNDFSMTFQRVVRDLPTPHFKTIEFSAWVRTPSIGTKAALVMSLDSDKGNVKYMGVQAKDFVTEANKWTQINGTFDAPENVDPNLFLKLYVYNAGKESVDVDDVKFELK